MKKLSTLKIVLPVLLAACSSTTKLQLEEFATLNIPPANLTITPENRIIATVHPFANTKQKVIELATKQIKNFPNNTWSHEPKRGEVAGIKAAIGIRSDSKGIVWILDMGGNKQIPKLVAWNTTNNNLAKIIYLPPPIITEQSFLQDFVLDETRNYIYIADSGRSNLSQESIPAIILVNLKTGLCRRMFEGARLLQPEQNAPINIDNKPLMVSGLKPYDIEPRIGLNPIALDNKANWLYFGSMNGTEIYRLRVIDLLNKNLSTASLDRKVERYSSKPVSDGMTIDASGRIFITDLNNKGIAVIPEGGGNYKSIITSNELLWPDGLTLGPDNYVYVTVNQLHQMSVFNKGKDSTIPPFKIFRFNLDKLED